MSFYMKPKVNLSRRKGIRGRSGFSIVELLVALLLGTTISLTMLDMYSKVQGIGTSNQNELRANLILQELVEQTRSMDYEFLSQLKSQDLIPIPPNLTTQLEPIPAIRTQPAQLNFLSKSWNPKIDLSKFSGTVNYRVDSVIGSPRAVEVTISVSYTDGEHKGISATNIGRTITAKTVVTDDGVNRWTP